MATDDTGATTKPKQDDSLGKRFRTGWDNLLRKDGLSVNERNELRRSKVRAWATHLAGIYLFILIPVFALLIFFHKQLCIDLEQIDTAKDLLLATMPVASAIIAYWFGSRGKPS